MLTWFTQHCTYFMYTGLQCWSADHQRAVPFAFGRKIRTYSDSTVSIYLRLQNTHLTPISISSRSCLCSSGCNIDVKNADNIRADITALKYGHNDIAELLDRLRATGNRDLYARQLVPTSKPAIRLSLRLLGNCAAGKTSLFKSLGAGLFSALFRRSSSLQSNKCESQIVYKSIVCHNIVIIYSASIVAASHSHRNGLDIQAKFVKLWVIWES